MMSDFLWRKDMIKKMIFTVIFILAVSISFTACEHDNKKNDNNKSEVMDEVSSSSEETSKSSQEDDTSSINEVSPDSDGNFAGSKEDTVNIKIDSTGKVKKIEVETTLKELGDKKEIKDISNLQDIIIPNGDTEYKLLDDGEVIFNTEESRIEYKGSTSKELPVGVNISYELDGKEISAHELAGKSGKVKIRFDYDNHTSANVSVKGKKYEVKVPFVFISALMLSEEHFKNIKVKNGGVFDMSDEIVAYGIAMPGLKDSLKLDAIQKDMKKFSKKNDKNKDDEIKIPDYVEITADVEDFKLEYSLTIVSKGIFADIDKDTFKGGSKFTKGIKKLGKASDKLSDATDKMYEGVSDFGTYLRNYTDGVSKVSDGAKGLSNGLNELDKNSDDLRKGTNALSKGLKDLKKNLDSMDTSAFAKVESMQGFVQAIEAMKKGVNSLYEGSVGLSKGVDGYTSGIEKIKVGAASLSDGLSQIASSGYSLNSGYTKLITAMEKLSDGMEKYNEKAVKKLTKLEGDDLSKVLNNAHALKKADKQYGTFTGSYKGQDAGVTFVFESEEIKKG